MAGNVKHMERSHRSYHDKLYHQKQGFRRIAVVSKRKQSLFQTFKEHLAHRKQLKSSKGEA